MVHTNNRGLFFGLGDPQVTYTIQASSDLIHWTSIGTSASDANGRFNFDEGGNPIPGIRFFRAVLP